MNDVAKALYGFWSSFGIDAYVEGYIPDDAELPYISFSLERPDWKSQALHYARVWVRDTAYTAITELLDQISARIGEGLSIPSGDGFLVIYKDESFIQFQPDEDVTIKIAYLSMILEVNKH